MPDITDEELARYEAAEEVCFTLLVAMGLDILPPSEVSNAGRDFIAKPMDRWAELAEQAGLLAES